MRRTTDSRRPRLLPIASFLATALVVLCATGAQARVLSPADDDWRAAATSRIERYRMGPLVVLVRDSAGRPLPGAKVYVRQLRHAFNFGTAIRAKLLFDQGPDGENYRRTLLRLFNYVTFESELKWHVRDTVPDIDTIARQMLDWCTQHNLEVRGHTLLWPSYPTMPQSARDLSPAALRDAIHAHILDYVSRFQGPIVTWDVINEPVLNHAVLDELGNGIIADTFRWAHEANPKVGLAYNDFGIIDNEGTTNAAARNARAKVVDNLIAQGAPVSALGLEAHLRPPFTPASRVVEVLDQWSHWGLPLEITELDVSTFDDALQAQYLDDFMTAAFSEPKVRSIVIWGFWEGMQWQSSIGGAMVRRDWTPRPAFTVFERLVKHDWWTAASGRTGLRGRYQTRAFLGSYAVTVAVGRRVQRLRFDVTKNEGRPNVLVVDF